LATASMAVSGETHVTPLCIMSLTFIADSSSRGGVQTKN
jgi:hypothetical protein